MSSSLWLPVATAPSTSEAVERAALLLPSAPLDLPCSVDQLSFRALQNLTAACRALHRSLTGIPAPQPLSSSVEIVHGCISTHHGSSSISSKGPEPPLIVSTEIAIAHRSCHADIQLRNNSARPILGQAVASGDVTLGLGLAKNNVNISTPESSPQTASAAVSESEIACATILTDWAQNSSHTTAPSAALLTVATAKVPDALLRATIPMSLSAETAAVLIIAIVPSCSARVATAMVEAVILPRICSLSAPAHRDFMKAVVLVAETHWRSAVSLFRLLSKEYQNAPISGPAAELLVRVSNVLGSESAGQALMICSTGVWREDGVRVIEALLANCKSERGVSGPLVAGLERNIQGMENSLRYGKLLFTAVKEVPEIAVNHADVLRSISSKSTVFLGKRAYALLTL